MASVRSAPTIGVICDECGDRFELSLRNEFEHRRRGVPHRCRDCRFPQAAPSRAAIEQAKRWWLERFTLDELRSWPPL